MATLEEQIKSIEDEIQKTPYNKATQHHIGKLKAKVARLKDEQETRRLKSGGGGPSYAVKKSGNATVGLVGFPSVGKSTLLNAITDATSAVAAYDFTTLDVIPGLLEHRGAKIQVLDMPGLIRGASKGRGRGKEVLSVARGCDLILLMIDVFETHVDVLEEELRLAGIRLNERPADVTLTKANRGGLRVNPTVKLTKLDEDLVADICREWGYLNGTIVVRQDITEDQLIDVLAGNRVYVQAFVVVNKIDLVSQDYVKGLQSKLPRWKLVPISAEKGVGIAKLKDEMYETLQFMRVFLKPQGKEADLADPLIVNADSDVGMVCDAIIRDWRKRFRCAIVLGPSAQFPGAKGWLELGIRDVQRMFDVNLLGTRNVLAMARQQGVGRFVFTSTAGVFAPTPKERPATESSPVQVALSDPYVTTKVQAHQLVAKEMGRDLPVTIVLPAAVFGAHDTGQLGRSLALLVRGKLPRLPKGFGTNTWTHAEDIAEGHVLAATRGRPDQLYLLGDRVLPLAEFYADAARAAGVKPPTANVPMGLARFAARFSEARARLSDRTPLLSRAALALAAVDLIVDASKARRELGWSPHPFEDRLRETMEWYVATYRDRKAPLPIKADGRFGTRT